MISLSFLFWLTLIVALGAFWWGSDSVKSFAISHTLKYCRDSNVQLLDQTMVLKGLWPVRTSDNYIQLRRRYQFEFTSTGAIRSKGQIILIGTRIKAIELEAHILPEDQDRM